MRYPIVLLFNPDLNDYKVCVPDIAGCFCRASTMDKALTDIITEIELHLAGLSEADVDIPVATSFESHVTKMEFRGGVWAVVDIDISPFLGRSHKINVTLPDLLIKRIDDMVAKNPDYKTRSGFLAQSAINELTQYKEDTNE